MIEKAKKYFLEALNKTILTKENAKQIVREIVNEEKVSIEVEHKDLKSIANKMEKSSERVTLGIIAGAFIVGSTLIMQVDNIYFLIGGVAGFITSGVLGLRIAISITHSGKEKKEV
ncbi:MAG: hypothetical protein KAK00_04300 [Nanoarchaeota archaeon]|nr:hypothetical protein [Nanoarchaeota archaeon]